MAWQLVTTSAKVSADSPLALCHGDKDIAIFKVGSDYYATDNVCPHAYALLTDGFVDGDKVECALHGAIFHIPTGRCMGPPADSDLATYAVKIENDNIYVDI
jgi:3-phenylpropionate/trans-cinnamate dioxygenase ferredoxin subunit